MKIVVTGGSGYFGSVIMPVLIREDHSTTILDMKPPKTINKNIQFIKSNIIKRLPQEFENHDIVIHLASLSRKMSEQNPDLSKKINFETTKKVAEKANEVGMKFMFASTCSVYENSKGVCDENTVVNPYSNYARDKLKAENILKEFENLDVKILRFATMYGRSPNMRFDLLINKLIKDATTGKIIIPKLAEDVLPFIHVKDAARAVSKLLKCGKNGVFNIGSNSQNFKMSYLAEILRQEFEDVVVSFAENPRDKRNYTVSFNKLEESGISTKYSIKDAISEFKTMYFKK